MIQAVWGCVFVYVWEGVREGEEEGVLLSLFRSERPLRCQLAVYSVACSQFEEKSLVCSLFH